MLFHYLLRRPPQASRQAKSPLEIPEIASLVASYLQGKDLASCVRVSKSWQDLFLPHRWRVIEHGSKETVMCEICRFGPANEDLYHHRHLVQDLSLITDLQGLPYCFPNLRKLTVNMREASEDARKNISLELVKNTPLLVSVDFTRVELASASWLAILALPHIKNLALNTVWVEAVDVPVFWKACEKMEVLIMRNIHIKGGGFPTDVACDRLRKLVLRSIQGVDDASQLNLILRSPKLESLDWCGNGSEHVEIPTLIKHSIQDNHWPHLNKLIINNNLNDSDMASILKGVRNLVHLVGLFGCTLGTQASKAFALHFNSLVKLNLASCYSVASSTIRDVFCCCERLQELRTRSVFAKDIAEGGPWVCQQLRELWTCFRVEESEQDLQRLVFERLSTLVRLENLSMFIPDGDQSGEGVLEFRLECGLDQLASLQQLTSVFFIGLVSSRHHYVPQMGLEEVAWMKAHLKLRVVYGTLNKDRQVDAVLQSAMRERGPSRKMGDEGSMWTFLDWRRLFSSFMQ